MFVFARPVSDRRVGPEARPERARRRSPRTRARPTRPRRHHRSARDRHGRPPCLGKHEDYCDILCFKILLRIDHSDSHLSLLVDESLLPIISYPFKPICRKQFNMNSTYS